jgi:hypothetical protein
MTRIPVYYSECHQWSDGEEHPDEHHNRYYDIKYFIVYQNPVYAVIYAWKPPFDDRPDDFGGGLLMELKHGLDTEHTYQDGDIDLDYAKELVRKDLKHIRHPELQRELMRVVGLFMAS